MKRHPIGIAHWKSLRMLIPGGCFFVHTFTYLQLHFIYFKSFQIFDIETSELKRLKNFKPLAKILQRNRKLKTTRCNCTAICTSFIQSVLCSADIFILINNFAHFHKNCRTKFLRLLVSKYVQRGKQNKIYRINF